MKNNLHQKTCLVTSLALAILAAATLGIRAETNQISGELGKDSDIPAVFLSIGDSNGQYEFIDTKISDIAQVMSLKSHNAFDVVCPSQAGKITISLRLLNNNPYEAFMAMNELFLSEGIPFSWNMRMIGKRPVAVLQPYANIDIGTYFARNTPKITVSTICVLDILYTNMEAKWTTKKVGEMLQQVLDIARKDTQFTVISDLRISVYEPADLIIASGTREEIDFVKKTLGEFRETQMMRGRIGKQQTTRRRGERRKAADQDNAAKVK